MKALNIVETAYRATLEEQDDTVVWISHAMKNAGAELDVLLRGNAVNYAVKGQQSPGLAIGARVQQQGPRLADDVKELIGKGVQVFVVGEDLSERGIRDDELIEGLKRTSRARLPGLLGNYDYVWHW
jgi:sulfur relay (sulfurtransferase) DsrF/TusC family protein